MSATNAGVSAVLRALLDANVQFVVVGDLDETTPLRLVASRHPTSMDALGRALDGLDATLRTGAPGPLGRPGSGSDDEPRRIGDALGTVAVTTSAGDVDVVFGAPRRSLYADVARVARQREIGGVPVPWVDAIPEFEPSARVTSRMLGRRLQSLAEGVARLIERDGDPPDATNGGDT
jgi:hypothetical protein